MSENEESKPLSRRDFLKVAGAYIGSAALLGLRRSTPEPSEILRQNELSIGALRVESIHDQDKDGLKYGIRILKQVETALQSTPLDLLITPEYSFNLRQGPEKKYEPRPLVIQTNGTDFTVDTLKSSSATRIIVENAQSLAKTHRANLFLSSFNDPSNEFSQTIALFINKEGEISGIKRKMCPPEGKLEIVRGDKTLKILPMICGDVWSKTQEDPSLHERKVTPPNWVKENAPYDIFVHTINQRDFDINKLAAIIQGNKISDYSQLTNNEQWQRETFNFYYGEYLKYLSPNAPILLSDAGMAGCFSQDLRPIDKYYDMGGFVVAKFDISQQNQSQK